MIETGDRTGVVQHLAGSLAGEVGGENSRGSQGARRWEASASRSYLEQDERLLSKGAMAAAEEVEVVGTCVYYYLAGPGHDARSRIGMMFVFSSEALFKLEQQGVVQCWTRRQEWGHCLECGGVSSL